MQIPETPLSIQELDLMKRLNAYATGSSSWITEESSIGQNTKAECQTLYTNIVSFVTKMLVPLLDRIKAREMETFTMHDSNHSLKVAHLIWHILRHDRRDTLTPPEIAILVISAFLHDLGMALSPEERENRLDVNSDLWNRLEIEENLKNTIIQLKEQAFDKDIPDPIKKRARRKLCQAEEVLLCQDTRERHASYERYEEILNQLQQFHKKDPTNLPDVESCLSYAGDSFREKLIEICVSHNQDISYLLDNDETHIERPRFPKDYTLGPCTADLHMSAAALRLSDILDFDRERTPPVMFHYLLPTNLAPDDDKSFLEWSKHLTISNWQIDKDAIVFRGHCTSHIIHHAVVQFCDDIENEIKSTMDTFSVRKTISPFNLPKSVQNHIEQHGYTYVPYKFELDDHRVYGLLMGGAIYENPLVAVRELVQNAVDACKLRDALTRMYEPHNTPSTTDRITIRYEEPTDQCREPKLTVTDTGTGMDQWILEKYFLKVGKSYYSSSDFNKIRLQLRTKGEELDFAPVSEFGIGFLSCFLIADRLQVITAMWEVIRGDTLKRKLVIDGPTRLIRQSEERNEGLNRFKGTSVTLLLTHGSQKDRNKPAQWYEIKDYLKDICQDLPYRLNLEHVSSNGCVNRDQIDPIPLFVELSAQLEPFSIRIPVNDQESGLEGEITIINPYLAQKLEVELSKNMPISVVKQSYDAHVSYEYEFGTLLRGGFNIGRIEGLPRTFVTRKASDGKLRFNWNWESNRRYPMPNLARSRVAEGELVAHHVFRLWLGHLLSNVESLPEGLLYYLELNPLWIRNLPDVHWLEQYDALTIYKLARQGWRLHIADNPDDKLETWESCTGESLILGGFAEGLYRLLLNLILPKITTLQMSSVSGIHFYVKPPKSEWRKILGEWRNFITSPVQWGSFVEYIGDIKNVLSYEYPGSEQFNSRFRKRLIAFVNEEELNPLLKVLHKLTDARGHNRQAQMNEHEIALFERAQEHLGNLEIGGIKGSWRIDSFKI